MLYLDFEASTEKEATQLALESLGLSIEDVQIEPLNQGKKSFFGLGKKENAKIRVYYKEKNEINEIIEAAKDILLKMDKKAQIDIESSTDNRYVIKVESSDPGRMIGKDGRTMQAIQNIVNAILQKHENKFKVIVDIDNYNERAQRNLLFKAKKAAKTVQQTKEPITLDPLNPYQRRLIHMELKKFRGITTKSNGDGKFKRITIELAN